MFGHEQVEVHVVVDVHPRCPPTKPIHVQAMILCLFGECAVFLADHEFGPQTVTAKMRICVKDVHVAVLVDVGDGEGHAVDGHIHVEV